MNKNPYLNFLTVLRTLFWAGILATAALAGIPAQAQTSQSCLAPITAQSITLQAQTQSLVETVTINDVQQAQITIDWGDGTHLTGGGGTYSHAYLLPGTYEATIAETGFLGGLPCSSPPTVFATVTVTACTGANCKNAQETALIQHAPPGIFKPAPTTAPPPACDPQGNPNDTRVIVSKMRVFYSNSTPNVPNGWPIVEFCASNSGMARFDIFLIQGAPGFPTGVVFTENVFVTRGWNAMIPEGPPPPTATFGYLGPFYRVETRQTVSGQVMSQRITWGYYIWGSAQFRTVFTAPRIIPLGSEQATSVQKN